MKSIPLSAAEASHVTTGEFARLIGVKGQTVRRGLCVDGHYLNVKPIKLPNRRLLWPVSEITRLLER
jgi:hypothetical protein